MERLAQRAVHESLSVRETEEEVRRYQQMLPSSGPSNPQTKERPAAVTEAQRALADRLQTRVRVDFGKRKGKISIDFVSLDELERLTRLLIPDE